MQITMTGLNHKSLKTGRYFEVSSFLICQTMRNDLAAVGVYRQVQLASAMQGLCAMFLFQPLANAIIFQPGIFDQNVNGPSPRAAGRCLWLMVFRSGPSAQRGVIRHRQIQCHQIKCRTQKPFALAQTQPEYHAQH